MKSFIGLMKKDLDLLKFWYIIWLICTVLGAAVGIYLAGRMGEPSTVVPMFLFLMTAHLILMPIMVFYILNIEGKTQMWLYNPQSSVKLLLSKLAAAGLLQLISQVIMAGIGMMYSSYLLKLGLEQSANSLANIKLMAFFQLGIAAFAVYLSIWIIFLWTIYHSLGKYPRIKNFRWLIIFLFWIALNTAESFLQRLFHADGPFTSLRIEIKPVPDMTYQNGNWTMVQNEGPLMIQILPLIIYMAISVIVFIAASRLLDKKVEV